MYNKTTAKQLVVAATQRAFRCFFMQALSLELTHVFSFYTSSAARNFRLFRMRPMQTTLHQQHKRTATTALEEQEQPNRLAQ